MFSKDAKFLRDSRDLRQLVSLNNKHSQDSNSSNSYLSSVHYLFLRSKKQAQILVKACRLKCVNVIKNLKLLPAQQQHQQQQQQRQQILPTPRLIPTVSQIKFLLYQVFSDLCKTTVIGNRFGLTCCYYPFEVCISFFLLCAVWRIIMTRLQCLRTPS